MAKQDYILRYLTVIWKLRRSKEATFEEIKNYLFKETEFYDRQFPFSLRTFQRDLNEIRELFKVDIQFNFSTKVYYIADDQQADFNNRMLESIDTINTLRIVSDITKYMFFEKRKFKGTNHFYGLLHAIKNRIVVNLIHHKYENDEPTERLVEPYALKESRGRWYLFGKDTNDRRLKTFGLDRVVDFENTTKRFDYPVNMDINEIFRYSFGVTNPENEKPQEIVLTFDPEQGEYIKSYPIHESQEITNDNSNELRIKLELYITFDLIMEILSFGDTVEVVAPQILIEEIAEILNNSVNIYAKKPRTIPLIQK